jgi:hypothetical protein
VKLYLSGISYLLRRSTVRRAGQAYSIGSTLLEGTSLAPQAHPTRWGAPAVLLRGLIEVDNHLELLRQPGVEIRQGAGAVCRSPNQLHSAMADVATPRRAPGVYLFFLDRFYPIFTKVLTDIDSVALQLE